eukprot:scaffold7643_cov126-Cylindrotheca_fusiformis.AAC.3
MLLTAVTKQRLLITSKARDGEGAPSIDGEMSKLGEGEVASAPWWIACWLQRRVALLGSCGCRCAGCTRRYKLCKVEPDPARLVAV